MTIRCVYANGSPVEEWEDASTVSGSEVTEMKDPERFRTWAQREFGTLQWMKLRNEGGRWQARFFEKLRGKELVGLVNVMTVQVRDEDLPVPVSGPPEWSYRSPDPAVGELLDSHQIMQTYKFWMSNRHSELLYALLREAGVHPEAKSRWGYDAFPPVVVDDIFADTSAMSSAPYQPLDRPSE